jgi:hypothetical protein
MSHGTNGGLAMTGGGQEPSRGSARQRLIHIAGWVFVLFVVAYYGWRMAGIGLDLRQDFWVYCAQNHFPGDMDNALNKGDMVLREAETVAQEDEDKKTPAQREEEAKRIAAGNGPLTIARPGAGLFDAPFDRRIFWERWARRRPLYSQILRGWVRTYDKLQDNIGEGGDFLDYPPMRLMVMTLWTWDVQTHYPGVTNVPLTPQIVFDPDTNRPIVATVDIVQPMLKFNATCEGITSISIFILVWLWMERSKKGGRSRLAGWLMWPRTPREELIDETSWRARWGDPLLLLPLIAFVICKMVRSNFSWQMPMPDATEISIVDARVTSVGWWIFLLLRFLAVVCLARFLPRPYRSVMCALVAATMAWLDPGSLLDSFGWPQWDCWLPPFFLVAAILVTLDWWIAAGLLLGVGCMFKGQLLFVSPVLILCPLLAGWPGRFLRIVAGLAAGAGLVVWPWLVTNMGAMRWIFIAVLVAGFFCVASSLRGLLRKQITELARAGQTRWRGLVKGWSPAMADVMLWFAMLILGASIYVVGKLVLSRWTPSAAVLVGACIAVVPWFLPRRLLPGWLMLVFAAALWLVGFNLGGSWSWWKIGFVYGTQKHPEIQLGEASLSNLSSILGERYGWQLHDHVTTWNLPILGTLDLDVQRFCGWIFFASVLMCTVAAAIHMRRRDPRFLIALVAPWVLFTTLLTQMTARYTVLPAVIGSSLIGISAEMSLLPFLQTVLACVMLGNQMMLLNPSTSPIALSITQPTHPALGWGMMLVAATYLVSVMIPSRRRVDLIEVV